MHHRVIGGVAVWIAGVLWSPPALAQAQQVYAVLQGQSNAYFLKDEGHWTGLFGPLVKDLTGIPAVTVLGQFSSPNGYTIASGTATYNAVNGDSSLWLWANSTTPASWPLGTHGQNAATFLQYNIAGKVGTSPVAFFRFHSEYDQQKWQDNSYYAEANHRFVGLMRSAAGLSANQMPVFYGPPAYGYSSGNGINPIRSAWLNEINDPANNAHNAFGTVNDINDRNDDNSHLDYAGGQLVAARMALAYARYLFDKGYAVNNLSALPKVGPRIAKFSRVSGAANQIDLLIEHDKGTALVIPAGASLSGFEVFDGGTNAAVAVTGAQVVNGTTLRLTLAGNLSASSNITLDYLKWNRFSGPDSLITDNWHTLTKPSHIQNAINARYPNLKLPLRRLPRALQLGTYEQPSLDDPYAASTPNPPAGIPSGTYLFTPQCAPTRAMDVYGGSSANGARVTIWTKGDGDTNRRWVVTDIGNGLYSIRPSLNTAMALDVPSSSTTPGTLLQLWQYGGGNNQKWAITSNGDGTHRISPAHAPNLYLTVVGNANVSNTDLSISSYTGATGQKWTLSVP